MIKKLFIVVILLMCPMAAVGQKFQVSTNAMGWACLATMNAEMDFAVARHWTLGLSGRYNPFTYGTADQEGKGQFQMRQISAAFSARWWPWHVYSGWWLAGKLQWQEYNMGGIISSQTEEGQRYGAGLTGGYTHMISKHFNIEFGLGFWGGVKDYVTYSCPTCGERLSSGVKAFILPNDFIVAVSYVF